ncbi:MAG: YbaN family protein [Treponema sp.]|jgi:uncharacterized membrane protein YbaN (DUF454 family)|nr:YbaN family protein [Treponema sp.]
MKLVRLIFVPAGFVFLALGITGIVLPLLPATPFLLAASFCFLRGSERFHRLIMSNPHIGPRIRRFKEQGLSLREKISIYAVVLAMLLPVIVINPSMHLKIVLTAVLVVKAVVFIGIRTAKGDGGAGDTGVSPEKEKNGLSAVQ